LLTVLLLQSQPLALEKIPPVEIVHGSVGGTWTQISGTIADLTNQFYDGHPVSSIPGAGGVGNVSRLGEGKSDIGLGYGPFLKAGINGLDPYKKKYANLRAVAALISNQSHILATEESGIKTIADIKARKFGAKIGTGVMGSTEQFTLMLAFQADGITADDIKKWGGRIDLQGTAQRTDAWNDKHMDIINFFINAPAASVTELMTTRPGKILSLSEATRKKLSEDWGYVGSVIPANSYPKQTEAVATVGLPIILFATDKASESFIYNMTKAVAENKERMMGAHPAFKEWEPKDMVKGLTIQVHPGALKYYKEKGWM
jgi:TRAP transporter TAXI family solute receptor